jgi:hypothetical protein
MTAADHWLEVLRCPKCKRTGTAQLSDPGGPKDVKVDIVPEGLGVFQSEHGINFYCSHAIAQQNSDERSN